MVLGDRTSEARGSARANLSCGKAVMRKRPIKALALLLVFAGLATAGLTLSGCNSQPVHAQTANRSPERTIENKGSDTLVNLALAWAEAYMEAHPSLRISVTGGGTGTGIAAMLNGTVDMANASREIKAEEIQAARNKGMSPQQFAVAGDAIAVIVNRSNPATFTPARSRTGEGSAAKIGRSSCFRVSPIPAPTSTSWRTSSAWARRARCSSHPTRC